MKRANVWFFLSAALACSGALSCGGSKSGGSPQAGPAANTSDDLDKAIDALADQIVQRLVESAKTKVGVNEFLTLKGETTDLGKFLSEELSTRIINSRKTQVVERRLLQKVLAEQEMGASNLVDDETAAKIGKLLGADTLCTGTLTDLGAEIKVNARLINAETAEVYGAASIDLPKSRAVLALLGTQGGIRPAITTGPAPSRNPNVRGASLTNNPPPQQPQQQPAITTAPPPVRAKVVEPTPVPAPDPTPDSAEPTIFIGKAKGPDVLLLHNKTKYCVRVWMNGKLLRVVEKTQEIGCIPDREISHIRLGGFGEYRIQASGSAAPTPFNGVVGYDRKHILTAQQKKLLIVFDIDDFYTVR